MHVKYSSIFRNRTLKSAPIPVGICSRTTALNVENAITREKKQKTIEKLKKMLATSTLAVNIDFQGTTVSELQEFRRSLPSDAHFIVAKNTLLRIASKESDGWSDFGSTAKRPSGILVVEHNISDAITAYESFVSTMRENGKKENFIVNGGMIDGKMLSPAGVIKLKN